ncbi:hypothetical protein [Streptomyces sp. NPDC058240]|uniref:hypothetical protein n=1 Tax=Streptomyces sp. NPDC058240 TaxID=3346396 RepID=UPI0036E6B9E7
MTEITSKYANFEDLREQVVALRREGLSLRQIRDWLHIHNNDILGRLVKGEPTPRSQDMTYDQFQVELGYPKSSISPWVRDPPKPEPRCTDEERRALMNAGLSRLRTAQDEERLRTTRKNTTETYRGCLIIYVTKSADLYRRVEGTWYGIVLGAGPATG